MTAHTGLCGETLYAELLSRIQQTDLSVPWRGTRYTPRARKRAASIRSTAGARIARMPRRGPARSERTRRRTTFMAIGDFEVSPDERRLAYTTDSTGYRQYTLHVKSLDGGGSVTGLAERVTSLAWALDDRAVLHAGRPGLQALPPPLPHGARRRATLLYEERDEALRSGRAGHAQPRVCRPDARQPPRPRRSWTRSAR